MSISFKRGPEYGFDIIHHTVVLVDKGSPFFVDQGHWNPRPSRQGQGSAQVNRGCAYLQQEDFAGGTSGKTSRLIHGGLRYLRQFRFGLVRQAARERDLLLRIAPGLVKPPTFVLPVSRQRGPGAGGVTPG